VHEPNLFNNLFSVRIREDHSPKENFLSECFAHILRAVPEAREAWVSRICGRSLVLPKWNVSTRSTEVDPSTRTAIFPDLRIDAITADGRPIVVFAEHKWDSPCRVAQLESYRRIARDIKTWTCLVFVGARRDQVESAKGHVDASLYWENAYEIFECVANQLSDSIGDESKLLKDFLFFMKSQGLGPVAAITPEKLQAFVESNDLPFQLSVFCRKLADEYDWDKIPKRYHGTPTTPVGPTLPLPVKPTLPVEDRYGRVAMEFSGANWAPTITLGFLYSNSDHRVPFTDPGRSIDLMLRIEANPKANPKPESLIARLKEKSPGLRQMGAQVLIKGDPENRNHNTLLIIQQSLTVVLNGVRDTHVQLDKIHETFQRWLSVVFDDGALEPELLKLKSS
jgi:hypothetical protein